MAKRVLEAFDFVAIVEHLDADIARLNALFDLPADRFRAEHQNTHSAAGTTSDIVAALPDSVTARFARENDHDLALYAWLSEEYVPPEYR